VSGLARPGRAERPGDYAPPADAPRRPRVALVLGSGGVKCAAAVGVWKVLAREGITVDVVVGCSGGSIYAAAYALGRDVAEVEEKTLTMWRDLFRRLHVRSLLRVAFPRLFGFSGRVGLLDDRRVQEVVWAQFGGRTFDEARLPLHIATTDHDTGEKVVLSSGSIPDAVRASIAFPLLLRPWEVDGRLLVDGGASNPLPVDVAIREGCDVILALGFENHLGGPVGSLAGAIGRVTTIVTNHLLRSTFAFYSLAHHAEVIPMMPTFDGRIGLTDADRIPDVIAAGERAAEEQLPYLRRVLEVGR
jgi:NTE family protein